MDQTTRINQVAANRRITGAVPMAIAAAVLLNGDNEIAFDAHAKGGLISRSPNGVAELEGAVDPLSNVQATLTTALTGADNDLVFTALQPGAAGNAISIRYIDPAENDVELSVVFNGSLISVTLATGVAGAIESTSSDIAAALASYFSSIENAGADDGTGVVAAMSATPLTGGVTGTGVNVAGRGSRFTNYGSGAIFKNSGTATAPEWEELATV